MEVTVTVHYNIDVQKLLTLVSERPVLWDREDEHYQKKYHTTEAWRQILDELSPAYKNMSEKEKSRFGKFVYNKWRNVRDTWLKNMKKIKELGQCGASVKTIKKYMYFEELSFMKKTLNYKDTEPSSFDVMVDYDIDVEHLITLVSERPILWDRTVEYYQNRQHTREAWRQIFQELSDFKNMSDHEKDVFGNFVSNKWRNLRDAWKKSMIRIKEQQEQGGPSVKKYAYHAQLSFLKKTLDIDVEDTESDSETTNGAVADKDTVKNNQKSVQGSSPKRKRVDTESEIPTASSSGENRHLSFFKGLLPSLWDFTDEETLGFQAGIISLVQNIKRARIDGQHQHQPSFQELNKSYIPAQAHHNNHSNYF